MASPRIGTYNILIPRWDHPDKGVDSWYARRPAIVETIEQEFDLVGLQEVEFGEPHQQGEFITDELLKKGWETFTPTSNKLFTDRFHCRLPIFWRPEVFNLETAGQLLLSSWTPNELIEVPILENRYASFVQGQLSSGQEIVFYTVHLQHQTAEASEVEKRVTQLKREEAQERLQAHMLASEVRNQAVIVAGDFNTDERPATLETTGLREITDVASEKERWINNSFHDWENPKEGKHFDRIFVTETLFGGRGRIGDSIASDHFPVSYTLKG